MQGQLTEAEKKSSDLTSDAIKQLLTLATGTLALTVTFAKDLSGPEVPCPLVLLVAWLLLVASIFLGVFALGGLTASMAEASKLLGEFRLGTNILRPLRYQGWTFFMGMLAMLVFGAIAVFSKKPRQTDTSHNTSVLLSLNGPGSSTSVHWTEVGETCPLQKGSPDHWEESASIVRGRPTGPELVMGEVSCDNLAPAYLVVGGADREPLNASKPEFGENIQLAYARAASIARLLNDRVRNCHGKPTTLVIPLPRGPETTSIQAGLDAQADDRTVRLYRIDATDERR